MIEPIGKEELRKPTQINGILADEMMVTRKIKLIDRLCNDI